MNNYIGAIPEKKDVSAAGTVVQKQAVGLAGVQLVDNRSNATVQKNLVKVLNNSTQVKQLSAYQAMADNYTSQKTKLGPDLREETVQGKFEEKPQKKNETGLPNNLKTGIEQLSGISMDDVRVHYNSDKPFQLKAFAFAQGASIHLASGQEKHLPHEAWHVVQQKQGRVRPTLQMKGNVPVNDDKGLENEADVMGAKAHQFVGHPLPKTTLPAQNSLSVVQRSAPAGATYGTPSSHPAPRQSPLTTTPEGRGKAAIDKIEGVLEQIKKNLESTITSHTIFKENEHNTPEDKTKADEIILSIKNAHTEAKKIKNSGLEMYERVKATIAAEHGNANGLASQIATLFGKIEKLQAIIEAKAGEMAEMAQNNLVKNKTNIYDRSGSGNTQKLIPNMQIIDSPDPSTYVHLSRSFIVTANDPDYATLTPKQAKDQGIKEIDEVNKSSKTDHSFNGAHTHFTAANNAHITLEARYLHVMLQILENAETVENEYVRLNIKTNVKDGPPVPKGNNENLNFSLLKASPTIESEINRVAEEVIATITIEKYDVHRGHLIKSINEIRDKTLNFTRFLINATPYFKNKIPGLYHGKPWKV